MCCSEVIDDGPLILPRFPTPWEVHESGKVLEGLRVMRSPLGSISFGDSLADTALSLGI